MAQGSYNEARDKLEELGWIKTLYLGRRIPVNVWVRYGIDDPNYEKKSWAKWHPSVKDIEKRYWEIVSEYVAEGRDIDALLEFSDAPADGIAFAEGRK
jgi:hypothetical protein